MSEEAKKMETRNTAVTVKRTADASKKQLKCKVTVETLNIRSQPDKNALILHKAKKGDIFEVSEVLDSWYAIVFQAETAYLASAYTEIIEVASKGKVLVATLNVRSQPNTTSTVLGKLALNDTIEIVKKLTEWYQINYQGQSAYVVRKFINEITDTVTNNVTTGDEKKYFYQREDYATIPLQPTKTIAVPKDYKPKIAATTWNNFGNLIDKVSEELKFEVEAALAVLCVESGGSGFANNKMIIRFENHVFDMYYGKTNPDNFAKYYSYNKAKRREEHKFRDKENGEWQDCHTSQEMEWKVFEFARQLSERDAIFSISLGAPQVMGFNYKIIGYASPEEMFEYFCKDIRYHLLALFDFCKYKEARIKYLQDKDFYSFAKEYNGTTAPKAYEERIREYYDIFKNLLIGVA